MNSLEEAVAREDYLKSGVGREWLKHQETLGALNQIQEPASVLLERIKCDKEDKKLRSSEVKKGRNKKSEVGNKKDKRQ